MILKIIAYIGVGIPVVMIALMALEGILAMFDEDRRRKNRGEDR